MGALGAQGIGRAEFSSNPIIFLQNFSRQFLFFYSPSFFSLCHFKFVLSSSFSSSSFACAGYQCPSYLLLSRDVAGSIDNSGFFFRHNSFFLFLYINGWCNAFVFPKQTKLPSMSNLSENRNVREYESHQLKKEKEREINKNNLVLVLIWIHRF